MADLEFEDEEAKVVGCCSVVGLNGDFVGADVGGGERAIVGEGDLIGEGIEGEEAW